MLMRYVTRNCDCTAPRGVGFKRPERCEKHGNRFVTEAELRPPERKPLRRVSVERELEEATGKRPRMGSTLKPGRGFAVAPAQRAKVKLLVCLGCGREVDPDTAGEWVIDAAHLVPRSGGGCADVLCVVPLCRRVYVPTEGCHPAFDRGQLDLHARIARGGYEQELAHAIGRHGYSPLELHQRLTGEVWVPRRDLEVAQARIVDDYERMCRSCHRLYDNARRRGGDANAR